MNNVFHGKYSFVSMKGYGDLTITLSMLRRIPDVFFDDFSILLGSHLTHLFDALEPTYHATIFDICDNGGAAIFALRTRGVLACLRSAVSVRASIRKSIENEPVTLVFDKLEWREKFLAGDNDAISLPTNQDNIYVAYENFLSSNFSLMSKEDFKFSDNRTIGIFPCTSMVSKNLSAKLIDEIASQCKSIGFEPIVFLLDGEVLDGPIRTGIVRVNRSFHALRDSISSVAGTICADSLPAHLSSYLYKPVFVVSPTPNTYWFPQTVYTNCYWGLFNEITLMKDSLDRFFSFIISVQLNRP